jgi:peptide/nickel transport system substrate-binding protein
MEPSPTNPNRGLKILKYTQQFTPTEKVIFWVLIVVALISAISLALRVSDIFSTEIPTSGGTLREGIIGLPRTINPVLAISDVDRAITGLVYSGLMRYDNGRLVPDIAQSYTISSDGLVYTFKLKPRVSFQDGTSLTTQDIVFTIQKVQDSTLKSPRAADWKDVTVRIVSPTEISFILKQPYSPFITTTVLGILPQHIWETVTSDQFIFSQYNTEPIGSGPYRIKSITRDGGGIPIQYSLTTWNSYYEKNPYLANISFIFLNDELAARAALDVGKIDSFASLSPEAVAELKQYSSQQYQILSSPLSHIFGVFFNQTESPALADITARKALDMAIDRKALIDAVLKGYGTPLSGPTLISGARNPTRNATTVSTTSSATSTLVTSIFNNIASAQTYLEKNGWKKGSDGIYAKKVDAKSPTLVLSFELYTANSPELVQTADLIKNTWNALGANVSVKVYEPNDLYQNVIRTRKYSALLFGEAIGKDRDLYAFWHSSQRIPPGLNISQYANAKTDVLLETMRATTDEKKRDAAYAQFDTLITADVPAIFLYAPDFIYAVPATLKGVRLNSITTPTDRWSAVREWYMETEKVWNVFASTNK